MRNSGTNRFGSREQRQAMPPTLASLAPKIIAMAVALVCGQASAADYTWTGGANGSNTNDWSVKKNWGNSAVPGVVDTAIINGGADRPTLSSNVTISTLRYLGVASGGTLDLGGKTLTITKDYDSSFFGSGNDFDRYRSIALGTGASIVAGTNGTNKTINTFQQLSINNGATKTTGDVTLNLGNVHVGQAASSSYQIYDMAGANGVTLRGAVKTSSDQFAGTNVTNWVATAGATPTGVDRSVAFTAATAGVISGQSLTILNNFATNQQTINIAGNAYNLAAANTISTPVNVGNVHVGGTFGTAALNVQNTASAGSFTEGLNASFGAMNGATGTGTITNLAGGLSNNTSLVVGLGGSAYTATAGAKSGTVGLNLASNGTISGLANTTLTGQTVSVTGGVYNLAAGSAMPTSVTIAAQRVGGSNTSALSVTNTAAVTGGYTERLDATFGSNSNSSVRNNGTAVSQLNAGNTSTAMAVGVDTSSGGAKSGSVVVNYTSNGTGTSGLGNTGLGSQTVQVSGNVYQSAAASNSAVNFGIVHVGDTVARGVATNSASVAGLNDTLKGNVSVSGTGFSGGGTFSGVAAQATDSSAKVTLNTANAGAYSGTANLTNLASHNSEMTDLALGNQSVALTGQVNNYAQASFADFSGKGSFTGSGTNYVLDFGQISQGSGSAIGNFSVMNSGGSASYTDLMNGTFVTTGNSAFLLSGFNNIESLAGGSKQGLSVTFNNGAAGTFSQLVTLNYGGFNSGGYANASLGSITVEFKGTVSPVPEPETWAMLIAGLAVVSLRVRAMKDRGSKLHS